jgi:hypothetical protein
MDRQVRNGKGFAMGLFLITLLVLGSISSSMIYITSQDSTSSRSANTKNDARIIANMVSDYISAQLKNDNNYIYKIASDPNPTSSCLEIKGSLPILNCKNELKSYGSISLDSAVSLFSGTDCAPGAQKEFYATCVTMFVKPITNAQNLKRIDAARLYVKVRNGCRGNPARCRYTSYQETFRQNNFFDYMYYVKYNTLDPIFYRSPNILQNSGSITQSNAEAECGSNKFALQRNTECINVNFTQDDIFSNDSIFFTEDYYYYFCRGNNSIKDSQVISQRSDGSAVKFSSSDICAPPPSTNYSRHGASNTIGDLPKNKPSEGVKSIVSQAPGVLKEANGVCTYKTRASETSMNYSTSLTLPSNSISLSNCNQLILFANIGTNDFSIIGDNVINKDLQISVVSTGKVIIDGNILPSTNPRGLWSITADLGITISKPKPLCEPNCDKTINAFLFSHESTISVDNWAGDTPDIRYTDPVSKIQPKLRFKGSIVGKYQPVFGSFNGVDGTLYSGYLKDFLFDSRVKKGELYIPYIIAPKDPQWEKFELVEIASSIN